MSDAVVPTNAFGCNDFAPSEWYLSDHSEELVNNMNYPPVMFDNFQPRYMPMEEVKFNPGYAQQQMYRDHSGFNNRQPQNFPQGNVYDAPNMQRPQVGPNGGMSGAHEPSRPRRTSARRAATRAPKRKSEELTDDEESDNDCIPKDVNLADYAGQDVMQSAADIAKTKYNDVKDEKERKRLKRLLRNRVSAQLARERKKAYLSELEVKMKDIEDRNEALETRVAALTQENFMLRQNNKKIEMSKDDLFSFGSEEHELLLDENEEDVLLVPN